MRSNCLLFALALWCRRMRAARRRLLPADRRPYFVVRRSRWGLFPHFLVGRRRGDGALAVVSYVPTEARHKRLPPPLFSGRVRWGD